MTCKEKIKSQLKLLPSLWADKIANVICDTINIETKCEDVKECETLTSLSVFSVEGTEVCITYTDEAGDEHERCFDFKDILSLREIDPKCITTPEIWETLDYKGHWQAIIDKMCQSCNDATTTTTSSSTTTTTTQTVTTSSTTTTTTQATTTTTTTAGTTSSTTSTTTQSSNPIGYFAYMNDSAYENLAAGNDNVNYQFSMQTPITGDLTFPFTSAANNKYIVIKLADVIEDKSVWFNTPFNQGTNVGLNGNGDQVMRGLFTINGFTYYVSRNPFVFDGTNYSLTLKA